MNTQQSYLLSNLESSSYSNLLQRKRLKGEAAAFLYHHIFFIKKCGTSSSISVSYFGLISAETYLQDLNEQPTFLSPSLFFFFKCNTEEKRTCTWFSITLKKKDYTAKLSQTQNNQRQYAWNPATRCKVNKVVRHKDCFLYIIIYSHSLQHFCCCAAAAVVLRQISAF